MRILVLNWQDIKNPYGGGAEVYLHQILKRIVQMGHSVTQFSCSIKDAPAEEVIDGINIIRKGKRSIFNFIVPLEYSRKFRFEKYDIVIDDMNKIPFYTPLYIKRPLLGMVMHLFDKSIFKETIFPVASYVYMAEKIALSVYKSIPVVAISKSTYEELIEHGFKAENVFLVPCAVDHEIYKKISDLSPREALIGYVGRIKKYKSVDHLLYAFKIVLSEIPNARLIIIGEGDGRKAFQALARNLNIEHATTFTGFLPTEEKVRLLNQMQVVVNTSAKEGWGLTVTEANACGVPAVASDVPGLRDAVKDGETGLLYEYGNIEQLAEKIILILRDKNLREKLARGALEYAQSLTWDQSAKAMIEVIEKVVKK